jgi:PKD repeat protein
VGFYKSATEYEVTKLNPMVQDSVTYSILKLTEGVVDTLIVECLYKFNIGDPSPGGYWRYVLVHYDNPLDEPPIPGNKPHAGFIMETSGTTITFNNTTTGATSCVWDFGDGQTSTAFSPVYAYATGGVYSITLTATNSSGSDVASDLAFISNTVLTNSMLQGAAWKVQVEEKSVFVGSGLGKSDWWSLPKSFLNGGSFGGDDWSCMPDDEFIFATGGSYTYATKGSARNDGYFGIPTGCYTDAQIAASGNGAAFGSAVHSYMFTPASGNGRPLIALTNSGAFAAFIGFYKGYYGGENNDSTKLPNGGHATNTYEVMGYANTGTKEYLFVSVDITADHSGSAAWSVIMER